MNFKFILAALLVAYVSTRGCAQKVNIDTAFEHAEAQTKVMLESIEKAKKTAKPDAVSPRTLTPEGELRLVASRDWTSGFFLGQLWYLYEYTGDDRWLSEAKAFTANIEQEKINRGTHDMGFKIYCSFGSGYRLTNSKHYKNVIVESARTLSTRFNPAGGAIGSWDHNSDKWDYPVIINNMMNLELQFAATRHSGDSSFYNIAVTHANTTIRNHFSDDYSTYHVVDFNPATGQVQKRNTHQGYSHESAWARGQAWGLYGYTMCYRKTRARAYVDQAEKIAKYILQHPRMPKDLVPYWDFDAPRIPNEPRDVSAAAVIASALYELSIYSQNGKSYRKSADKILESLSTKYAAPVSQAKGFILEHHSTSSKPADSVVDVPLSYADYYYLEALLRKKHLQEGKKI